MVREGKEKRRFKRYPKECEAVVNVNEKPLKAKTLDYSLDGLKVVLENSPPIKNGDILNLNINCLDISQKGSVVWIRKLPSATVVGISRIGDLKGALRDFRLQDILIGLQRSLKTGILELKSGPVIKKTYISNGDIIFSESNQPEDRLGDILFREGRISRESHDRSVELIKKTGKRQGAVLVEMGCLKPQDLVWSVMHQVEETILGMFNLYDGNFKFVEGPLPKGEVITLKLSAANLIYRGTKRTVNFELLKAECPADGIVDFSRNPLNLFQDIKLDDEDRKILSYVNGKTSIGEIVKMSPLAETETLKDLYALLATRILEIKEAGEAPTEITPEEIFTETAAAVPEETIKKIEDMYVNHIGLGYYGVLGVKDWASSGEIKRAYYRAAKQYHPDVHFRLPEDLKGKLHEIFTCITDAYTTLSDPEKRKDYDRTLKETKAQVVSGKEFASSKFEAGKAEFGKGRLSAAAQLFAEAAYLDASQSKYHYYYGITLARLNRLKEAERALGRAFKVEPSNPDILAELGHVYLKMGFPLRAKGNFEKALKLNPSSGRAKEGMELVKEN